MLCSPRTHQTSDTAVTLPVLSVASDEDHYGMIPASPEKLRSWVQAPERLVLWPQLAEPSEQQGPGMLFPATHPESGHPLLNSYPDQPLQQYLHQVPKYPVNSDSYSGQRQEPFRNNVRLNELVLREQSSYSFHPAWKREWFPLSKRLGRTIYNVLFCFVLFCLGKNGIVGQCINICRLH